jgi:hypothetical protein
MSIFKNRRLDLKKYSYIDSSYIFGEMEHDGMLLFISKIVIKSSHKRRALARSGLLYLLAKDIPNKKCTH